MGLNWIQPPKINLNSKIDAIQIQMKKLDNTEKRIINFQTTSKFFYNDKEIKNFAGQSKSESLSTINTTEKTTNSNTSSGLSGTITKTVNKTWLCRKSNKKTEDCFVSSHNGEVRQIGEDYSRFQNTERGYSKEKSTNANNGRIDITNFDKSL